MRLALLLYLLCVSFSACTKDEECGGSGGKCDVQIGDAKYCSKCAGKRVPINGFCRIQTLSRYICPGSLNSSSNPGTCDRCLRDFLLYKGGCYRDPELLNLICKSKHIIDQEVYCGNCGIDGDIPINGECVSSDKAAGNTCANGVCTQCGSNYFHHYGSCYSYEGQVGSRICLDGEASVSSTPSVCSECAPMFVNNPSASSSTTSCLACYGLEGTLFCENCRINVLTDSNAKATLCTKCKDGFAPVDGRCVSIYSVTAALAGCTNNTDGTENMSGLCSSCSSGYMLFYGSCYSVNGQIAAAICAPDDQIYLGGRVLCKKCAQSDHYPIDGLCNKDDNGNICSNGVCTTCIRDNVYGTSFFPLYGGCYNSSSTIGQSLCTTVVDQKCTVCNTTSTSGIVTNPDTTTADAPKCLACWDKGASDVANCGQCSTTGGEGENANKIVCNKCSDSTDPSDGKCPLAVPPKNPAGCAVDGCQKCASGSSTECEKCFPPLLLLERGRKCSGSCKALGAGFYNDNGVCKPCLENCLSCNDGTTCSACLDGFYLDITNSSNNSGLCKSCSAGCRTCDAGGESQCTSCIDGYYQAFSKTAGPGKCVTCNSTTDGYNGVQNCATCFSTTGSSNVKNVVCLKCEAGYVRNISSGNYTCTKPINCNVSMCEICVENNPSTCEHCGTGSYLIRSEGLCTKNCTEYNGSMYSDDDLQECQYCKIENCATCKTGLLCANCSANSVPVSPDIYHTSCLGCSDTVEIYGWVGLPGCSSCELTSAGSGPVNCLDPNYYRQGSLSGGSIAAIVIVVLILLAVAGFLVWWFLIKKGVKRGGSFSGGRSAGAGGKKRYASLINTEEHDYRQALI